MGLRALRREGCLAAAAAALMSLAVGHAGATTHGAVAPTAATDRGAPHALTSRVVSTSRQHRSTDTVTVRAATSTVDSGLTAAIRSHLETATANGFAAVVDVAGVGRVVRLHAGHASHPASTQKLFTTGPILLQMSQRVLTTQIRATARPVDGVVHGNLVVTARRDPSLTRRGLHVLAAAVHAAGVHRVTGHLNIDIREMSLQTRRDGWKADSVPWDIGPLSPFPVNEDAYRSDSRYLSHPTTSNGSLFRRILLDEGVRVVHSVRVVRSSNAQHVLASHVSPTFQHMVKHTLRQSDNFYAESFLFIEGVSRVTTLVETAHVPDSVFTDGSGLSYSDRESPRGEVKLLHYLRQSAAWPKLLASLPVGCRSGTLSDWFCNTIGADHVWAKTGTLLHDRCLAGFTVDAQGRQVTFSVLVRGVRDLTAARHAIAQSVIEMRRYDAG